MKNLKLYYISDKYINYLRKFDTNVAYNKRGTRPYLGVVCQYNECNYFVPLASPKEKHLNISSRAVDIYKIKNGELGVLNLNNMIPVSKMEITEVLPLVNDEKYKMLLENQLSFINNHKADLYKKVKLFFSLYLKNYLPQSILKRCCDFKYLEIKMKEYSMKNRTCTTCPEKTILFD